MRIIRGKYRSKQINLPASFDARPTTDFAKEGLFNILENRYDFENMEILDLFAGSGNISYEFLSRDCKRVTAVEINSNSVNFINKTGEKLFPGQLTTIKEDVFKIIKKLNLSYDIIFADPPFNHEEVQKLPELIFANISLKQETLLIVEHASIIDFSQNPNFQEKRNYGKINFTFFQKKV